MTEFIFVGEKDFSLQAQEVIREFSEGPCLLLRIAVVGPTFPQRNSTAFVRLVGDRGKVESLMAEVSPDQKQLRGYFPADIKIAGRVEFGYASQVLGSVPIKKLEIARLDVERIDPKVRKITLRDLGPFKPPR